MKRIAYLEQPVHPRGTKHIVRSTRKVARAMPDTSEPYALLLAARQLKYEDALLFRFRLEDSQRSAGKCASPVGESGARAVRRNCYRAEDVVERCRRNFL